MARMTHKTAGQIEYVVMQRGIPVRFDPPAQSVTYVDTGLALVIVAGTSGDANLVIVDSAGIEIGRIGTSCGTGLIYEVLEVEEELRVIEAASDGDYQARLDLDGPSIHRLGEWR